MMTILRHPGRLWRVLVVFSRYFILPKLPFRSRPEPGAVRMRLAIEELGGAWVKLGQMLAMRFDLLPPALQSGRSIGRCCRPVSGSPSRYSARAFAPISSPISD